jgi:hypothetical protein
METTNLIVTKSLMAQAIGLAEAHNTFHTQYVIGGRKALYVMLANIMRFTVEVNASVEKDVLLKSIRHELQNKYNIKTQANSSTTAILVKYITRADRKTTHVYARAIDAAIASDVKADEFVEFAETEGGLEQISAIGVDADVKEKADTVASEKFALAEEYLIAREEVPFEVLDSSLNRMDSECRYEYLMCINTGKQLKVVMKVPADLAFEQRATKLIGDFSLKDWEKDSKACRKFIEAANIKRAERIAEDRGAQMERERAKQEAERNKELVIA